MSNNFNEDGSNELDNLFQRVEASPWKDREKDNNVPSQVTDIEAAGFSSIFYDNPPGAGLINGSFDSGPADDETATIDTDDNTLPGWDFVEVQGTWSVIWTADANAPFGYSLVATQASSSASDEFYLEQTIPISYYRRLVTAVRSSASNANMQLKIACAFLDEAGNEVGSTQTGTFTGTTETTDRLWREPPALAVEARIRVGVVNVAGTASQTRTILFISVDDPVTYSVIISGSHSYLSPAISSQYDMPYPTDLGPDGVYIADTQGFVLGIGAKTQDTISAGTITARVENDTQATNPGPTAALSSGVTAASGTASLDGATTFDFAGADQLHLELLTDGSYSSTGNADYFGSARLLLVINDEGDW